MILSARIALISVIGLTLIACESVSTNTNATSGGNSDSVIQKQSITSESRTRSQSPTQNISLEENEPSQIPEQNVVERKIIRNANLTLETSSPEDAARKITAIAAAKNGFIVSSDTRQYQQKSGVQNITVNVVLRVPSAQFEASLEEIRRTAERVEQEKISGQDVTEEFIDLEARINAKKALEAQFLEIMKQAKTVEDALKVQTELASVRSEIEQMLGRRKFLENQTSFSTINITLVAPTIFAANSTGFLGELWLAISDGVNAALSVILFFIRALIALTPLIIIFGIPFYLLIRYLRRKSKRQKLAQELAQDEKI